MQCASRANAGQEHKQGLYQDLEVKRQLGACNRNIYRLRYLPSQQDFEVMFLYAVLAYSMHLWRNW